MDTELPTLTAHRSHLDIFDLAVSGTFPELGNRFGHMEDSTHMGLGQ